MRQWLMRQSILSILLDVQVFEVIVFRKSTIYLKKNSIKYFFNLFWCNFLSKYLYFIVFGTKFCVGFQGFLSHKNRFDKALRMSLRISDCFWYHAQIFP